jgi:transaldolase/glucose-6-phosphate isomerase
LIGLDIQKLLDKGLAASEESLPVKPLKISQGFTLGAALGEMATVKDKLTIWTTPSLTSFTGWLEQLLAESTGKQGRGVVPIVEEPFVPAEFYGRDRVFVGFFLSGEKDPELERGFLDLENAGHPTLRIVLDEKIDLGLEFFRWELATASAGAVLGIHPFNQPDVQLAKDLTRSAMEKGQQRAKSEKSLLKSININEEKACRRAIKDFFAKARPGDYVAVQAYLAATPEIISALNDARNAIFKDTRLATTLGLGPRFLHSTGQLHKGGPNSVLAIQLIDEPENDLPVPGTDYTFASLIEAQANGDIQALLQRKRRVFRIQLGKNALAGLKKLEDFLVSRE